MTAYLSLHWLGPHHKKTGMREEVKSTKRCSVVDNSEEAKQESVDASSPSVNTAMETNECACVCVCW